MAQKDASIVAQVAAKAAAELYQGLGDIDGMANAMVRIFNGIVHLGGDPMEVPENQSFAAEQNLAQGGIQATVQRDLSSEKGRWEDLFAHPGDWWDNRNDSRATINGGNGPDFRFKNDKEVKGLFLNGRYGPAPAWVFEKLGLPLPAAGAPAADPGPGPAQGGGGGEAYGPQEAPF